MKPFLLATLAATVIGGSCLAQSSSGLIAHWKMTGNGADASGNGHTGTLRSVTPAVGRGGNPGTALRFNGPMTYISVPYQPDLNLTTYSICATVMVEGFYSGQCQANYLLGRDAQFAPASYSLLFFENPYNDCSTYDSTKEVFAAEAGSIMASQTGWQYTPNIVKNQWYRVVATFDGSDVRIYVNDSLKVTNNIPGALPLTSSTAGLLIGRLDTSNGYQYPFTGVIDDIKLYNRVLSASEVVQYGASTLDVAGEEALAPLSLFPNPAHDRITVQGAAVQAGMPYQIYNALGQLAASGTLPAQGVDIPVAVLNPGLYYLRIGNGLDNGTLRFLKN